MVALSVKLGPILRVLATDVAPVKSMSSVTWAFRRLRACASAMGRSRSAASSVVEREEDLEPLSEISRLVDGEILCRPIGVEVLRGRLQK